MRLDEIPWNIETPPEILVDLVESGRVKPCKALDLGCGTGNYAIYLARRGFEVTGVDISSRAVEIAKNRAAQDGVSCEFIAADVLGDMEDVRSTFDFAYDWELLHHIFPKNREKYVRNVERLLNQGGRYLSVCFSGENSQFGGAGKYRKTPIGTVLYFSSEEELRDLFGDSFEIEEMKTLDIRGKHGFHRAVYTFMTKNTSA